MNLPPEMRRIPFKERELFTTLFLIQHLRRSPIVAGWKDKIRHRVADHLRQGGKGRVIAVPRLKNLAPEDFREQFLKQGRPVIFDKAAVGWPCLTQWSFDGFKQRFGHETIKLVHQQGVSDDEFVDGDAEYSEELNFGDFLDQVLRGGMKYMRFSPLLEKFPELLNDFDQTFLQGMPGRTMGSTYQMFIGAPGTFTPLHNTAQPFFFVNVTGIKQWVFIPNHYMVVLNPHASGFGYNHSDARVDQPDAADFPGLDAIDRMEAVMEPGDVAYVPSWMWHCVRNHAPTIGVRCGFFYPKSMVGESPLLFLTRVFAARNPTVWEAIYYTWMKKDLPERSRRLTHSRVYRYRKVDGQFTPKA